MNYKILLISILISLFFIGCEKDKETFVYEEIDLIDLSTIYGMTREEINDKFSETQMTRIDNSLNEEYLIKTKVGNYNLHLSYHFGKLNENNEFDEVVFTIRGEIAVNSRTSSIDNFKNLINSNFKNFPDLTYVDLEFGYGGTISGTEVTYNSFQDLYDSINESQNTYGLLWIDGGITYSICLLEESILFTIETEDYKVWYHD